MTSIAGTVVSNSPISNVFAMLATLPISQFKGLIDLEAAAKLAPNRIAINGASVTFTGPVAIVSSMIGLVFGKVILSAIAAAVMISLKNRITEDQKTLTIGEDKSKLPIASILLGIATAGLTYYFANKYIPSQPGIFFRDHQFLFIKV